MKIPTLLTTAGTLALSAVAGHATVIGFGQLGGNNTAVPGTLGSNATVSGNGFDVGNGTTPDIALVWDPEWDVHTSANFAALEGQTIGGGAWDNEGNIPRIGQIERGQNQAMTIQFVVADGYALVLNSFDMANTKEVIDTATWDLVLTDSSAISVWNQTLTLDNNGIDLVTVAPAFTGLSGQDYTLSITRTSTTGINGQTGIDNLSFNQVAIPEPSATLLILSTAGLLFARRRRF